MIHYSNNDPEEDKMKAEHGTINIELRPYQRELIDSVLREGAAQKLPPYRSTECCPKCGGREFSDRWVPGDATVTQIGVGEVAIGEERIERTCTNCGYVIKEAPNDAS
jgi:RNA polymerase subunit RPABC4/transcription elongation factor Spt4